MGAASWRSLVALIGHERLKSMLELEQDALANRIAHALPARMRGVVKESLLGLLSERSSLLHSTMGGDLWRTICTGCDLGIGTLTALAGPGLPGRHEHLRSMLGERVVRITVKPFMDIHTMIEERLTQCCMHVATVNGGDGSHQCAPFCAVQAWAPLATTRLSTASGGARTRGEVSID